LASFTRRQSKRAEDGKVVHLLEDSWRAWFVGCPGDEALDPYPMGAFHSQAAAQHWADERFSGGAWTSAEIAADDNG
jgi:hypothetical protein